MALAMRTAGSALAASQPDVVLVYSTQWIAVLDQLWLTRPQSSGLHVDENWYEFGDLPYEIASDGELASACVAASPNSGIQARGVDYDGFPLDTGTIVAAALLGIGGSERPLVVGSNNVYHNGEVTEKLAGIAVKCAAEQGKRVAVVAVGGLSGSVFRTEIDLNEDRIVTESDDEWNQRMLKLMESGNVSELRRLTPEYAGARPGRYGFQTYALDLGGNRTTLRRRHGARLRAVIRQRSRSG